MPSFSCITYALEREIYAVSLVAILEKNGRIWKVPQVSDCWVLGRLSETSLCDPVAAFKMEPEYIKGELLAHHLFSLVPSNQIIKLCSNPFSLGAVEASNFVHTRQQTINVKIY